MDIKDIWSSDPEIMGGAVVFAGTRVPLQTLFDYLEAGDSIEIFLEGFPTVKKAQVLSLLDQAKDAVLEVAENSSR